MNLHNISDQEFDRELRKHLYDSDIPYNPESWDKMNKKLELFIGINGQSNGSIVGLSLISLLLAGVFFLRVISFTQQETNGTALTEMSRQLSEGNDDPLPEKQDQRSSVDLFVPDNTNVDGQRSYSARPADRDNNTESTEITAAAPYSGSLSSNRATEIAVDNTFPGNIRHIDPVDAEPPPVIKKTAGSPWFIGFGYAPDISMVGFGELSSPGSNLILSLEHRLGARWSIQTGIIYSSKKYKAKGEEYHPPEDFWDYGEVPEGMDAKCDVIDIPVNLRYYFKPGARHQFYASTGLSTYLMLTEDYYYDYGYYGNPNSRDYWSVKNENQHFFGIYNFSAGYQKSIGKQWYLEIEPFIKVPLSGVGFGEVDLWSTGSMFSLKYNFR